LHYTHFRQELKNDDPNTNTKRHKLINPRIMHNQQQTKQNQRKEKNKTPQLIIIGSVHTTAQFLNLG
jgi:hypothetical protein